MKQLTTTLTFVGKNLILIISLGFAIYSLFFARASLGPEIVFLDVGQGDAILIQQENFQVLIDTGPDDSILYELPLYMPFDDHTIEFVILTHPHDDHVEGLYSLLRQYDVKTVLYNSDCFDERYPLDMDKYDISLYEYIDYKDIHIRNWIPEGDICDENANNNSIVTMASVGGKKAILMGDAEVEEESLLLSQNILDDVNILKAGHHCSRTASSEMFLTTIKPELAICSCGEGNSFGHPHSETLKKFDELTVQYLISYKEGNIVIKCDN